jgi:hypothetical protein
MERVKMRHQTQKKRIGNRRSIQRDGKKNKNKDKMKD